MAEDSNSDDSTVTEHVERTDVGVSITATLKRGTATRDQDKLVGKVKARNMAEAESMMTDLKSNLEVWAADLRDIQPDAE